MKEEWRIIQDFPDYAVSNFGEVRRIIHGRIFVNRPLAPIEDKDGYLSVCLSRDNVQKIKRIHHLVLEEFVGEKTADKNCNHIDGIKANNHLDNLEWVTQSENELHAHRIGLKTGKRGEKSNLSKLKNGEVWLIKKLLASGKFDHEFIAKMLRVNRATITYIANGKTWRHIIYDPTGRSTACGG